MAASWSYDNAPSTGHPLHAGAAPHDIRAALLPEDHAEYHRVKRRATELRTDHPILAAEIAAGRVQPAKRPKRQPPQPATGAKGTVSDLVIDQRR